MKYSYFSVKSLFFRSDVNIPCHWALELFKKVFRKIECSNGGQDAVLLN